MKTADTKYCANVDCPFNDCKRHWTRISELKGTGVTHINLEDFSGVCRQYIGHLVDKIRKSEEENIL